ncbi:MAG TPA: FHA domain-containing protein [Isosphaeraceae bacterium]
MPTSWTIGSAADCDLVVDDPKVSGHHCRLTREGGGYVLEDLNSTNGTFLKGVRVTGKIPVARGDAITLGLTTPMPWPSVEDGTTVIRIGREPDNDVVIDLPIVSGRHARVIWAGVPGEAVIEDLGSSNGTGVGAPERKVTRAPFTVEDTIYLGTHPLPAAYVLARTDPSLVPSLAFGGDEIVVGRDAGCDRVLRVLMVSGRHARLKREGDRTVIEDLGSSNGTFVNGRRIDGPTDVRAGDLIGLGSHTMLLALEPATNAAAVSAEGSAPVAIDARPAPSSRRIAERVRMLLLLAQGPLIGLVLGLGAKSPASLLAWLGLAAVWFGLSDAVLGGVLDGKRLREGWGAAGLLARLGGLAGVCIVQCALCWAIASAVAGLSGPGLPSVGLLALAALVGLTAGLLIEALSPRAAIAWAALGPIMLVLWLFGGERQALSQMNSAARAVANALPSRWAFEGLLLLESDARSASVPDLAQDYFPAETQRTGPRGAAMALAFLLVGLSASAAFTARASRPAS